MLFNPKNIPEMFPFIKNILGYFEVPRYRLMHSKLHPTRCYLWDRKLKKAVRYFDSLEQAENFIKDFNLKVDQRGS